MPGQDTLMRRLGHYGDFVDDVVARAERAKVSGAPIGARWDVEGDPAAMDLVHLWGAVAEGVAANTELAAGEAYLQTARDWVDLARLADHLGYQPSQRLAAEGWVHFDIDRTASPLIPAGTRVQASGTATRGPQTYEVITDTQLTADWTSLTATWVPVPAVPTGRSVRFMGDPGFRAGDQVLLVNEKPPEDRPVGWLYFLNWLVKNIFGHPSADITPVAVVGVVSHANELGTTLVEFDRDVGGLLGSSSTSYAAYRILDTASTARRLSRVLRLTAAGEPEPVDLDATEYTHTAVASSKSVILDQALDDLSADRLVAVVNWSGIVAADVVPVLRHVPIDWEVVPGTTVKVSKLLFKESVGTLADWVTPPAGTIILKGAQD
ncbi:MAG: hypothetical protein H0V07_12200, partial [Propionibacteriales bacterium]|nr:hypothetical protein [Propionibacteriales bacterium]